MTRLLTAVLRALVIACAFAAAACGGAPARDPAAGDPAAYELVVRGELALRRGDVAAAAEAFEAASAIDPDDEYLRQRRDEALALLSKRGR